MAQPMSCDVSPRRILPICAALLALLGAARSDAGGAGIGANEGIVAIRGRAGTADELARLYDSRHCGECHVEIYDEWKKSTHARSLIGTGRTAVTLLQTLSGAVLSWSGSGLEGMDKVQVKHLIGCAKCHLPQLADATDDVAREIVAELLEWQDAVKRKDAKAVKEVEEKITSLSINCLICHNRNAIVHKWEDGYPRKRGVYGSKEGAHLCGTFPEMKKSPIMGEAVLCGQCHGLGPNFELDNPTQCATAYGNYLFSYVADGGKDTCQDCHMRKSGLGHNIQAYRNPAMIKAAVDFQVNAGAFLTDERADGRNPGTVAVPGISVNVAMTNRAGHSIPDG